MEDFSLCVLLKTLLIHYNKCQNKNENFSDIPSRANSICSRSDEVVHRKNSVFTYFSLPYWWYANYIFACFWYKWLALIQSISQKYVLYFNYPNRLQKYTTKSQKFYEVICSFLLNCRNKNQYNFKSDHMLKALCGS